MQENVVVVNDASILTAQTAEIRTITEEMQNRLQEFERQSLQIAEENAEAAIKFRKEAHEMREDLKAELEAEIRRLRRSGDELRSRLSSANALTTKLINGLIASVCSSETSSRLVIEREEDQVRRLSFWSPFYHC